MNRLADGADSLRKIFYRVMRRHVARFEMHFGGAKIIAGDEAVQDFGEKQPLFDAEPAHDAEIDRNQPAVVVNKQISRMHVGMEEAVAQRMPEKRLDQGAADLRQNDPI